MCDLTNGLQRMQHNGPYRFSELAAEGQAYAIYKEISYREYMGKGEQDAEKVKAELTAGRTLYTASGYVW